jgi:hypothetical protein
MIVRQLVTMLSVGFDTKGADAAEKRIAGLGSKMAQLFGFWQAFSFLKETADMASGVEQTMSKLCMVFQDNRDGVLEWAKAYSDATGASEFQMRDMASTFGSMLVPTLKFDRAKAAEMSKGLSALAFDLAAINNEDPEETMQRLFSGMTGETEGVERLGIGIKAAALQEFAHARGIKKKVTAMSIAEKTELIYNKILNDTKDKTGAAAKESNTYAGRMLKLTAAWRDAKTMIGQFVMGPAMHLLTWLRDSAAWLKHWADNATHMRAAAVVLGGIMLWLGAQMLVGMLPAIIAIGALYLVVEDLIHLFSGEGRSAIGEFIDAMGGVGTAKAMVNELKTAWNELKTAVRDPDFRKWVHETFDEMIEFGRTLIAVLRLSGAAIGGVASAVTEGNQAMEDYQDGKISYEEYRNRNIAALEAPGKAINQVRDDYRSKHAKTWALPELPVVGSNPKGGNLTINISGPIPAQDELERMKRAAKEARERWRGLYDTTSSNMTKAPPKGGLFDPSTDPGIGGR